MAGVSLLRRILGRRKLGSRRILMLLRGAFCDAVRVASPVFFCCFPLVRFSLALTCRPLGFSVFYLGRIFFADWRRGPAFAEAAFLRGPFLGDFFARCFLGHIRPSFRRFRRINHGLLRVLPWRTGISRSAAGQV